MIPPVIQIESCTCQNLHKTKLQLTLTQSVANPEIKSMDGNTIMHKDAQFMITTQMTESTKINIYGRLFEATNFVCWRMSFCQITSPLYRPFFINIKNHFC